MTSAERGVGKFLTKGWKNLVKIRKFSRTIEVKRAANGPV